jgi:hypothetical protein
MAELREIKIRSPRFEMYGGIPDVWSTPFPTLLPGYENSSTEAYV